ncbi:GDSL-type esterase/lipase family protein [Ligilactobacillus apodemi]|uniref:GDSL-like lipase acylhydrolase n=1 Tax=Ligilactobacillus apodemi DSM 16634 = JCM 16172 TaxID=1423724 RepID=A0A0R1TZM5_9LACO|nr:GDSL-type esterase/lipase family protein [Ligilactobacillus apodemi]KRL86174.1 GDSL-like lipase acylhydrolase [Ligilactobacillus apodemi DSM 16634 = JCM 16172]MBD5069104.1 acylhydrolase [Lactobacillus sp.]MBD5069633.1 acylhydrolase [Lactobacillus sp.]
MTKVVLFGDSLTAGVFNGHPTGIFTRLLEDKFPDVQFINRGLPGDQTRNACKRLRSDVLSETPDLVVIFFGTNDVSSQEVFLANYHNNLAYMLTSIKPNKCILITPGISGPTRQNLRPLEKMEQYAEETLAVAQEFEIPALDWYDHCKDQAPTKLLQADDLHYSEAAYQQLVEQLEPLLAKKLTNLN